MSNELVKERDLVTFFSVLKMADAHYRAAEMPIGIIDAIDGSIVVGYGKAGYQSRPLDQSERKGGDQ